MQIFFSLPICLLSRAAASDDSSSHCITSSITMSIRSHSRQPNRNSVFIFEWWGWEMMQAARFAALNTLQAALHKYWSLQFVKAISPGWFIYCKRHSLPLISSSLKSISLFTCVIGALLTTAPFLQQKRRSRLENANFNERGCSFLDRDQIPVCFN